MALIVAFALLCALSLENPITSSPVSEPSLMFACVVVFHLVVMRFAYTMVNKATRAIKQDWENRRVSLDAFARDQKIHLGLWIGVHLSTLYVLGWPQLVRENWGLGNLILVDDLLVMLPMFVSWFVSMAFVFDVHHAAHAGHNMEEELGGRISFTWAQARIYLGVGFVPLMLVSVIHDIMSRMDPLWQQRELAWCWYALPLILVLLLFPAMLRCVWPTTSLPQGALRDRLEMLSKASNVKINDILVWQTGGRIANAAIAGMLPWLRYVFLTDKLLATLTDDEIEATFAHELGHVTCWHLVMRTLAMLLPLSLWYFLEQLNTLAEMPDILFARFVFSPIVLVALTLGYMFFVFGWYTRQLEHEADLFACMHMANKNDLAHARIKYAELIEKLTPLRERNRSTWLHPNYANRVKFISGIAADPEQSQKFEWRIRTASALLLATGILPFLLIWLGT